MVKLLAGLSLLVSFLFAFWQTPLFAVNNNDGSSRIIVKFNPISIKQKENLIKNLGLSAYENLKLKDTIVLKVPRQRSEQLISALSKNFLVEYAEVDAVAFRQDVPNDSYYINQWGLAKIKAPEGWDISQGSGSVIIAIADTGIDGTHPDLGEKIITSVDCTNLCSIVTPKDGDGHGTHIAGIAAAITGNGQGIAGVGYNSSLYSVQVLDSGGSGYYSWIANGIVWATDNGANVVNLSLGGTSSSSTLKSAVEYAWNKGVVLVAAAGNNNTSRALYPAYYPQAIAVAGTTSSDIKASFSNYGSWVDVAAPGLDILSTFPDGRYSNMSGTSMATPFVSGLAGLIFAYHPGWSNLRVRNQIEAATDKIAGTGTYWTYGRINVCKALDCITPSITVSPSPTPTPTPSPTSTPSPTPTSTPTPTVGPTPTPSLKPWWCKYLPTSKYCL